MKIAKAFVALSLVLALVGTAAAQPGGGGGRRGGPGGGFGGQGVIDRMKTAVKTLDLSKEQQTKFDDLVKEYEPKVKEASDKMNEIYTPEQKKLREDAMAKMKDDPAAGRAAMQGLRDSIKLTDEQKTKQTEARKVAGEVGSEFRTKFDAILTDAQKEKLKAMPAGGGRGGRGGRGGAATPQPKQST